MVHHQWHTAHKSESGARPSSGSGFISLICLIRRCTFESGGSFGPNTKIVFVVECNSLCCQKIIYMLSLTTVASGGSSVCSSFPRSVELEWYLLTCPSLFSFSG
jgi:hypothetical protein